MAKSLNVEDFLASTEFWAAVAGAMAVFAFEWVRSWYVSGREKQDAVNGVLIALSQMYNELNGLWNRLYLAADARAQQRRGRNARASRRAAALVPFRGRAVA